MVRITRPRFPFGRRSFLGSRSCHILTFIDAITLADDEWSRDMTHNPCHWRPALSKGYTCIATWLLYACHFTAFLSYQHELEYHPMKKYC
jgi:hypothetical protein